MVTDDLDPCPALLRIKFEYDYNIKWADAFRHEVKSVNVWASLLMADSHGMVRLPVRRLPPAVFILTHR